MNRITFKQISEFRSEAFSLAASGKHGEYPYDETFNEAVEAGFSYDGTEWEAEDGTIIRLEDF